MEELVITSSFDSPSCLCDEDSEELHPSFALAISSLVSFRILALRRCGVTAIGMASLAPILSQFTHLQSLDLLMSSLGGDGASFLCSALSKMVNLRSLSLNGCGLGDGGFCHLASVFKCYLP